MHSSTVLCLLLAYATSIHAYTFAVPPTVPKNASAKLDPAPIGVSIEFFTFPQYFTNLSSTHTCLKNLKELTGTWPPMRIGGTTQDRATYNASSPQRVTYSVASPLDAPANLTFGPSFMSLADTYDGEVILGLNRRLANISNTLSAGEQARSLMHNLDAIELGNEPNFFSSSDPIAQGAPWTAQADFASQKSWESTIGKKFDAPDVFSAGVYFGVSSFSNTGLAAVEGDTLQYVKDFCSHNYPQSPSNANLANLMSHNAITSQIAPFKSEIATAQKKGKVHIMGETNSATGGGGGISPTFGAGLWVMDYSLQLLILGSKRLYFHQGTIGACPYCWWSTSTMGTPYYGAYFATMVLAGADHIAPLDDDTTNYAAYAVYKDGRPIRVLLYNSDYYVSGTRSSQNFTLTGLPSGRLYSKCLAAPSATTNQATGANPIVGGQHFANKTCELVGDPMVVEHRVESGMATFSVPASQAMLIDLTDIQGYN